MFAGFLAFILTAQAHMHKTGQCECGELVVTSWTVTVLGPDDAWGGSRPRVRRTPDHIEFKKCPYATRHRRHRSGGG